MRKETEEPVSLGKRTEQGADLEYHESAGRPFRPGDGHVRLCYTDIMTTESDNAFSA